MLLPDNLDIADIQALLKHLDADQLAELHELIDQSQIWTPLPGPQVIAYTSEADIIGFGGAAGGGKSDLAIGKAITQHERTIIFRREATQLTGIIDRLAEIVGHRVGYNGQEKIWREPVPGKQIELGSTPNLGDETKYQGRPHDFICVGKDTPVRMADGSYKPIQDVSVGDMVDTLEGPRRVNKVFPIKHGPAVTLRIGDYEQIQSVAHNILTTQGWISSKTCRESIFSATVSRYARKFFSRSLPNSLQALRIPSVSYLYHLHALLLRPFQSCHPVQRLAQFFSWRLSDQESDCAKSLCQPLAVWRLVLKFFQKARQLPFLCQLERGFLLLVSLCDAPYVRSLSLLQDLKDRYLGCFRLYGVRILEFLGIYAQSEVCQALILQSNDAAQPSPKCSLNGGLEQTPTHISRTTSYDHPYGKGIRRISGCVERKTFCVTPAGMVDLYDIEVDDANHYITGIGIVNSNCFDEAANMIEHQVRFLMGWLRTTTPGQKCQALLTFNPPTTAEGRWVIDYFAPWLDPKFHGDRALPGELRYAASIPQANGTSRDIWVERPDEFILSAGCPLYEFDRDRYKPQDIIKPMSRTFIPSKVSDNTFLVGTGYMSQLQALPEPLRSQMLNGDFMAGVTDDPWQVIPTAWVDAAMDRWTDRAPKGEMDSVGVDVARGGQDSTVIARRHGQWYDKPLSYPGSQTPDGPSVAGLVISALRDNSPIHIDVIGVGSSPYDFLVQAHQQIMGVNVAEKATSMDRSGRLQFFNQRTELWWQMREDLDPAYDTGIALPPDPRLKADLCAPRWVLKDNATIKVESREDIIKRIGKSPDYGSAYVLARMQTRKRRKDHGRSGARSSSNWRT